MSWVNMSSELRSSPEMGRLTSVRWLLPFLLALVMGGLVAGVVVAQTNPDWIDWYGTEPTSISVDEEASRAWQPAIAAGAPERLIVAWSDRAEPVEAKRNLYMVLSGNNGQTWSAPQVITTPLFAALPDALIVGDRCFVAWVDQQTEGGQASAIYEAEVTQTGDVVAVYPIPAPVDLEPTRPRLAATEGRLHVVFNAGEASGPSSIMYATRPLTATAWPTATVVTSTDSSRWWFPSLAIDPDGETRHLVWEIIGIGARKVMYMRWGASDSEVKIFSPAGFTETNWIQPSIAVDSSGDLHLIWGEQVGTGAAEQLDQYVRYARYDAGTGLWNSPKRIYLEHVKVNADDPRDVSPSLALKEEDDQIEVCVAWHGFREDSPLPELAEEVLLSCSGDGGETWSEPQNMSRSYVYDPAATTDVSIIPAITFDTMGQLHGVWQERTDLKEGNPHYEIYHAWAVHMVFLPLVMRS